MVYTLLMYAEKAVFAASSVTQDDSNEIGKKLRSIDRHVSLPSLSEALSRKIISCVRFGCINASPCNGIRRQHTRN